MYKNPRTAKLRPELRELSERTGDPVLFWRLMKALVSAGYFD